MPSVKIVKKPDGKKLNAKVKRVKDPKFVKVGFPEGSGEYPEREGQEPIPIVTVAVWTEFGNARIPEWAYFRAAMKDNRSKYRKLAKRLYKQVLDGKITKEKALGLLGEMAVGDIQDSITNTTSPANSLETVARKGSSNPLIDTGLMKNSVRSEVIDG